MVPESRMTRVSSSSKSDPSEPAPELIFKDSSATVKEEYILECASGKMSTAFSWPINLLVSSPPNRIVPVSAARSFWKERRGGQYLDNRLVLRGRWGKMVMQRRPRTHKIQTVSLDIDQALVDKEVDDVGVGLVGGNVHIETYAEQARVDGGVFGESDLQSLDAGTADVECVLDVVTLGARVIKVLDAEGTRVDQLVSGAISGFVGGDTGAVHVLQGPRLAEVRIGIQDPDIATPSIEDEGDGLRWCSQCDLGIIAA